MTKIEFNRDILKINDIGSLVEKLTRKLKEDVSVTLHAARIRIETISKKTFSRSMIWCFIYDYQKIIYTNMYEATITLPQKNRLRYHIRFIALSPSGSFIIEGLQIIVDSFSESDDLVSKVVVIKTMINPTRKRPAILNTFISTSQILSR